MNFSLTRKRYNNEWFRSTTTMYLMLLRSLCTISMTKCQNPVLGMNELYVMILLTWNPICAKTNVCFFIWINQQVKKFNCYSGKRHFEEEYLLSYFHTTLIKNLLTGEKIKTYLNSDIIGLFISMLCCILPILDVSTV